VSVVCDTTVLIDVLRGRRSAIDFLLGLSRRPVCSEVTRIEVIQGLRSHERSAAMRLFDQIEWAAVDKAIAEKAGELGRSHRASHGLGKADLCVAATAIITGLPLATDNVKHFPMFPDLTRPYERE
jgi:predicted nucleic acid-binding protein